MKRILLLFGFFSFCIALNAQDVACEPDQSFVDSNRVVFPLPLDPETGEGGIEMFPACIGEPYELVFSFRVGDSATVQGPAGPLTLDLLRAEIATTGAVAGLPEGINYFCNPPDCIFPDSVLGCIVLRGIPTENNPIDTNELIIDVSVTVALLGTINETIPGQLFAGEYNLVVNESGGCATVSTNDILAANVALANIPNPVVDYTTIEVSTEIDGDFQFQVHDVAGKLIHSNKVQLERGYNSFNFDASQIGDGMYIYSLSNELGAVSQKMIVSRR